MTSFEPSDDQLVGRLAEGDEQALRMLVERHSAWLALRLRRRTSQEDLVAECLQDTFVAAWRSARGYRGEGEVGAWLWGIAVRRLVSRLRKQAPPTPVGVDILARLGAGVRSAEDELLVAVEHGDVGQALRGLSPELRTVLQATVIDGLSTREAATLLRLPHGTVKSRVRAAKHQLRLRLEPLEGWGR
jgi:RNA polymerase sigma-70 factor (ECF subfamily)